MAVILKEELDFVYSYSTPLYGLLETYIKIEKEKKLQNYELKTYINSINKSIKEIKENTTPKSLEKP